MITAHGDEAVSSDSVTQPVSLQPLQGTETIILPGPDPATTEEHEDAPLTILAISQEDSIATISTIEEVQILVENSEDSATPPVCVRDEIADHDATVQQDMSLSPDATSQEDCSSIDSIGEGEQNSVAKDSATQPVSPQPPDGESFQPAADHDATEELKKPWLSKTVSQSDISDISWIMRRKLILWKIFWGVILVSVFAYLMYRQWSEFWRYKKLPLI